MKPLFIVDMTTAEKICSTKDLIRTRKDSTLMRRDLIRTRKDSMHTRSDLIRTRRGFCIHYYLDVTVMH